MDEENRPEKERADSPEGGEGEESDIFEEGKSINIFHTHLLDKNAVPNVKYSYTALF